MHYLGAGARKAVIDGRLDVKIDSLRIVGWDGLPSFGQRLVTEGQLTATVFVPPVAGKAIEELFSVLRGGRPAPPEINVGVECYPSLESFVSKYNPLLHDKRNVALKTTVNSRR